MSIYNILAKLSALTAGENSAELNKTGATAATANDTLTEAAAKLEKKFRDWEAEDEPKEPTAAELETDKELKAKGKGNAKTLQKIADAYAKKKADESVAEGKIDDLNDLRAAKASGEEWTTSTGGRAVRKGHVTTHHAGKGVYGGDKPYKHGDVDDNDEDNKKQAEPAAPKKRGRPKKVREAALAEKAVGRKHLNEGLDTIAHRYGKEIRDFAQTGELDENLYHALYDYYFDDMPYGVKKARTADPYEWISDKLDEELRSGELEVKESNIATPNFDMVAEEPIEEAGMAHQIGDWVYSGSVAGEIIDFRGNDHVGPVAIIQSENGEHHAVPVSTITIKKPNMFKRMAHAIVGEDHELNELARLAGLSVDEAKKAKPDFLDVDKDGDKTEPMKKALKDKEVNESVDECMGNMSPIGSAETQDNISINSNYNSRDNKKTVSVTAEGEQAEALMQMLKMAGMLPTAEAETAMRARIAVAVPQEQEVEVEEAANDEVEYSNSPDEQYQGVDAIVHQGNDLNREKKQYASKPRLGDNPMTEDILTLESKLAAEYESIKKVTK